MNSPLLHDVQLAQQLLEDARADFEDAIRVAWRPRIPAHEIALSAGFTSEAAVRQLARRRGWRR